MINSSDKLLKPTQEEINNLSSPYVWKKHIFSWLKILSQKETWDSDGFTGEVHETFKEDIIDFISVGGPVIKTACTAEGILNLTGWGTKIWHASNQFKKKKKKKKEMIQVL